MPINQNKALLFEKFTDGDQNCLDISLMVDTLKIIPSDSTNNLGFQLPNHLLNHNMYVHVHILT